ncbi:MAG: hypothetical protein IJI92_10715 [Erysipelotrichaceae bacterium]|nr:hypothetical protein [Erysipelotrichaceae bacterium]MBQ6494323.1 hypothetical protein [Erysipelotrichaceae bacterium]
MKKLCILLFVMMCIISGCSAKEEPVPEPEPVVEPDKPEENVPEIKPFIEEYGFEILPADKDYSNPAYVYITDLDINIIEPEGFTVEDSMQTSRFYDYSVTKEDDHYLYTFLCDEAVPITITAAETDYDWYYIYSSVSSVVFDANTGICYKANTVSLDDSTVFVDYSTMGPEDDDFSYTDITWNGETYHIGVCEEFVFNWNPLPVEETEDGHVIYNDTGRTTIRYSIKTDKEYDGMMVAVLKSGTNKERSNKYTAYFNRYQELLKEADETGTKSEELLKYEERSNRALSLFESSYDEDLVYTKDDYYVFRVSDIPKAAE